MSVFWDKKDVLIVRAKGDAPYAGLTEYGYTVIDPYNTYRLLPRLIREIWFRLHLSRPERFFNHRIIERKWPCIIVNDPLITRDFLLWLQREQPNSRLCFFYGNLVGNARHILPKDIPNGCIVSTYDENDAQKYGLFLNDSCVLAPCAFVEREKEPCWDVLFVGHEKGRQNYLTELKEQMEGMGLRPCFYIVASKLSQKLFSHKYQKPLPYGEIVRMNAKTKAILNVVYGTQKGISVRDMEALQNGIKLITNNVSMREKDFYRPENIFILGQDPMERLPVFLDEPFRVLPEAFYKKHSIEKWVSNILDPTEELCE